MNGLKDSGSATDLSPHTTPFPNVPQSPPSRTYTYTTWRPGHGNAECILCYSRLHRRKASAHLWKLHRVSEKNSQNCFCHNFVKFPPTLIFFGKTRAKMIELCEVYLFTTSPNLCQRTTVCNTDAPNCYITTWLFVSDFLHLHHQFNRGCHVIY